MKRSTALMGLTLAVCALACAQDPNRVVVPARNTTHPRVLNVVTTHGSITVKVHSGRDVIVETPSSGSSGRRNDPFSPASPCSTAVSVL